MLRTPSIQQGIYYSSSDYPRNSFSVVFLRAKEPIDPGTTKKTLSRLWKYYLSLQRETPRGSYEHGKSTHYSDLSILIGYGPKFFEIPGLKRAKPVDFSDHWLFEQPKLGADPIIPQAELRYATDVRSNPVADDHVIIQFIGNSQLVTHRLIVDTWKLLKDFESEGSSTQFVMRSFYTGFNRPDGRGWLGFHDGISNIKSSERLRHILIDKKRLDPADHWTVNSTYMSFLRIAIDLEVWESIPVNIQERIVGRQKSTGCPLVKIDQDGYNAFAPGCPVPGTSSVTERGNERFRDYDFFSRPKQGRGKSGSRIVDNSHIQRMRRASVRIFRQGFEFIEPTEAYPFFRAGLNFVSFQGSTERLYRMIKFGFGNIDAGGEITEVSPFGVRKLFSVLAAGLFYVPALSRNEDFPGEIMFDEAGPKKPLVYYKR